MTRTAIHKHTNNTDTLDAIVITDGPWSGSGSVVGNNSAEPRKYVFAGLADGVAYEVRVRAGQFPAESDQEVATIPVPVVSGGGGETLTGPHLAQITIVDDASSEPIELADVRMMRTGESGRETSDVDGLAEFSVQAAAWRVLVSASGYEGAVRSIEVAGDVAEEIRLTSIVTEVNEDPERCAFRIRFIRVDGSPIVGAAIRAVLARERQCYDGGIVTRLDELAQDPLTDGNGVVTLLLVQGVQVYFTIDGIAESVRSIVTVPMELNAVMTCQR